MGIGGEDCLHGWADNAPAVQFYRARGYADVAVAEIAAHPRLSHRGGSILMRRPAK